MTEPARSRQGEQTASGRVFREWRFPGVVRVVAALYLSTMFVLNAALAARGPMDSFHLVSLILHGAFLILAIGWSVSWVMESRRGGGPILIEVDGNGLHCRQPRESAAEYRTFDELTSLAWRQGDSVCFETESGQRFVMELGKLSTGDRVEVERLLASRVPFYEAATRTRHV